MCTALLPPGVNPIAVKYTGCPTTYQTRQFFNNFATNEDIATKFEADLPHCVRNIYHIIYKQTKDPMLNIYLLKKNCVHLERCGAVFTITVPYMRAD